MKIDGELFKPERTFTSDKELVKIYVAGLIGEIYNIQTISVLRNEREVDTFDFPIRCAIKPTHSSGRAIIRRAGEPVDRDMVKSWFGENYYQETREGQYKHLIPKIIVEELVFDDENASDIKVYCFEGEPRAIMFHQDRERRHNMRVFDTDWNDLRLCWEHAELSKEDIAKPNNLADILSVSRTLASHFGLVRIDLYSNGTEIKVGEITHTPGDGRFRVKPRDREHELNELIFGRR